MKVLIAINNDAISEAIGNYYKKEYGEALEIKNVYYFKALLEEIKLNFYDRIIIHEELEPFSTSNIEVIDSNLFSIVDKISDEGKGETIILICSERRKRDDKLVRRMFNIGIYNVLIGEDRTIQEVTKLLNSPRTKKEAKSYIDYDLEEDAYTKDEEVNEAELNRILMAFENAAGDEDKYIEIFERIADQYTNIQLKVISTFLPEHVRRVLMQRCSKYKEISAVSVTTNVDRQDIGSFKDGGDTGVEKTPADHEPKDTAAQKSGYKAPEASEEQAGTEYKQAGNRLEVPRPGAGYGTNMRENQNERHLPATSSNDAPARIHKVTEVIEKEIIREVYETPKDYRKVVCFVGAHKTGTTFVTNAVATYLTRRGIKTAIIDVTRNKDTYFIYAINNENNRETAAKSLSLLAKGKDCPLEVNRISVYTGIPGQVSKENVDYMKMIEIAKHKHSVVLVDCDFDTPLEFFKICQNIYVVQDMDTLNLQPVTSFLRELKYRGVNLEKAKVVINKHLKCALPAKKVIEGLTYYSNPEMTIYDELFEKSIGYYILPFDEHNFRKYVEGLYLCKINYADFTEDFKEALEHLVSSVYPIGPSKSKVKDFKNIFNSIKSMISISKNSSADHSESDKYNF